MPKCLHLSTVWSSPSGLTKDSCRRTRPLGARRLRYEVYTLYTVAVPPSGSVGATLCILRTARGWSQAVLARKAGVSVMTISRIERGVRTPSTATSKRLAAVLETSLDALHRDLPDVSGIGGQRDADPARTRELLTLWFQFPVFLREAALDAVRQTLRMYGDWQRSQREEDQLVQQQQRDLRVRRRDQRVVERLDVEKRGGRPLAPPASVERRASKRRPA